MLNQSINQSINQYNRKKISFFRNKFVNISSFLRR